MKYSRLGNMESISAIYGDEPARENRSTDSQGLELKKWFLKILGSHPEAFDLSNQQLSHLRYLVRLPHPSDWLSPEGPMIYKSVNAMAEGFRVTPEAIRAREKKLEKAGYITLRKSSNGRRFGQRNKRGQLLFAFGITLLPLLLRRKELEFLIKEEKNTSKSANA